MSLDRYFIDSPKRYYRSRSFVKTISKIEVIALIYGLALFSLYSYVWRPSYESEGISFRHSPTLFFAAVWVVGSAISIGYAIWSFMQSEKMSSELASEADRLAEYLYKVETDLQKQLQTMHEERSYTIPLDPEYHSQELQTGRVILWEKYDALLE
jgi:hypothetical protein